MKSYSEDGTDGWIVANVTLPERGVYVDVGCAHPWQYSQTAFLRERGWRGIVVDGNDAYRPEWRDIPNTSFVHAVVSNELEIRFLIEPTNTLVSRRHETGAPVHCRTLSNIISWSGEERVDLLALDIEGMEFEAIQSMDLAAYQPTIIVAEFDSGHLGQDLRLMNYLVRHGYDVRHLSPNNAVYIRR